MSDAAAFAQQIERARQRTSADEGKHGVDAVRRSRACRFSDVVALAVDHGVGAEATHEGCAIGARRGGDHIGAATLGELHGEHADIAARAVDDQRFAPLEFERVVDALQRRESDRRNRAGVHQVEAYWNRRHLSGGDGDILRVEAAFWIVVAVGIHLIAEFEPSHARARGDDRARAIRSQDERHALRSALR
jgi:hypothetical protein